MRFVNKKKEDYGFNSIKLTGDKSTFKYFTLNWCEPGQKDEM